MNRAEAEVCIGLAEKQIASAKGCLEHEAATYAYKALTAARDFLDRAIRATDEHGGPSP